MVTSMAIGHSPLIFRSVSNNQILYIFIFIPYNVLISRRSIKVVVTMRMDSGSNHEDVGNLTATRSRETVKNQICSAK